MDEQVIVSKYVSNPLLIDGKFPGERSSDSYKNFKLLLPLSLRVLLLHPVVFVHVNNLRTIISAVKEENSLFKCPHSQKQFYASCFYVYCCNIQ